MNTPNQTRRTLGLIRKAVMISLLASTSLQAAEPGSPEFWPNQLSAEDKAYLQNLMKDTWHYIDAYRSPATGLPYDSNQARDITNTTNVGLYLSCVCVAHKLGYISREEAVGRIQKILDSLDAYEHWRRLYNNWLDPDGKNLKAKPGENNISDYNKLPAGLIVVRQTFPEFADRCTAFLNELPWELFHEAATGKICYAFDVVQKKAYRPVYFYRGEDKNLGLILMIGSGKVPASVWEKRDSGTEGRYGYTYFKYGWQGGGLFMHYMCGMFLDMRGTPTGKSAADFAWAQIVHSAKAGAPVWGWSAAVAPNGTYLGMNKIRDEVVTPHASALAISHFPQEVVANLRRLEAFGLRKPCRVDGRDENFGMKDSVNWTNGEMADKYLILDQAMLFLSLANYCENGVLWKTFEADPLVKHAIEVIAEYKDAPAKRAQEKAYLESLSWDEPVAYWLKPDSKRAFVPGDVIRRTLWARSLSSKPLSDSVVEWSVLDSDNRTLRTGREKIELKPRESKQVLELSIPTEGAAFSKSWTLRTALVRNNQTVMSQEEKFFFPSYKQLDGTWRLKTGDDAAWASPEFDDSPWPVSAVAVRWEDDILPNYDGMAWYRVSFEISDAELKRWEGKPLAVALGAVDDADETYLNGAQIGRMGAFPPKEQTAYNVARIYTFDRAVLKPRNVLAIRVSDWGGNGGLWRRPAVIGPVEEVKKAVRMYE